MRSQLLHRAVHGQHVLDGGLDGQVDDVERDARLVAAALGAAALAGVVDEHLAHGARRRAEEVRAVLPAGGRVADEAHVGLVHQGRGVQRVVRALVAQALPRDDQQLLVDQRQELLRGLRAARAHVLQHARDLLLGRLAGGRAA